MAKLRKFAAYQSLERPYTRVSKFSTKNFVRGGYPNIKITKFEMGNPKGKFDGLVKLNVTKAMNIRHNALESCRMTTNRHLEKTLGAGQYHFKIRIYPHHVLRENPLAAGAGADRMSTGMKKAFGKTIGAAARVREGQTVMEVRLNKAQIRVGKEALSRASKKLPCTCKIVAS
jgi:large subunit ribosomal protein L10e